MDHWQSRLCPIPSVERSAVRQRELFSSQQLQHVFRAQPAVAQDLVRQSRSDDLPGVQGHYSAATIFVTEEMVAAADAGNHESGTARGTDQSAPVTRGFRLMLR
jgi:hypothetical protein